MNPAVKPPAIEAAEVIWRDGLPESCQFGDVYFSRDNGLEESRFVFLGHNQLAERFANLAPGQSFVIAESGFGTGLNFLAAWQLWEATEPPPGACLHFVSVERYPLSRSDLMRALSIWPELQVLSEQLISAYPPLVSGVHRLVLGKGRVRLTLYFGEALEGWRELDFSADAWFLDGFAPARNPELWLDEAMGLVRAHSKAGTTLATFTAVGRVRRSLATAGFTMAKVPGYGRKREMLTGALPSGNPALGDSKPIPGNVAVIGAGVAGCLLARNLAFRGMKVTLIDAGSGAGKGASGNLQGALYVKLGVEFNAQTQLALSSLLFAQRYYRDNGGDCWHPSGLLQLAFGEAEASRQHKFLAAWDYPPEVLQPVSSQQASALAGVATPCGGLWYPESGWLEPARLCTTLAADPRISVRTGFEVRRLTPSNGQWHISGDGEQDIVADQVVLCAGHKTPELIPLKDSFRFRTIRGQVTHIPQAALNAPRTVICGPRYINPPHQGTSLCGASFDLHDSSPGPTAASHQENLDTLETMLPGSLSPEGLETSRLEGRVGFRCTTHDYQPVAGPLVDRHGNRLEGIHLFTGLGSKGLSHAPLLAEYLADTITAQPSCLPVSIASRLGSGRCRQPEPTNTETEMA